jgi:hypothetical protein
MMVEDGVEESETVAAGSRPPEGSTAKLAYAHPPSRTRQNSFNNMPLRIKLTPDTPISYSNYAVAKALREPASL